MGKALRRILYVVYLLTVLPLLACYLSQWISPASFWPLAFFGILFPTLILIQVIFIPLFLVMRSKAIVLPVLLVLLGWHSIAHSFQLPGQSGMDKSKTNAVRVMTYNVRLFDIAHYWSGVKDQSVGILSYVKDIDPDILCFQEFAVQESGKYSLEYLKGQLPDLPYSVVEYNFTTGSRKHGLAIFSRHPIVGSGHRHFEETRNMMLYADLKIGIDTIRVFNNHLQSIHFDRDEFQWIDTTANPMRIPRDKITEIVDRMKGAYIKRASQADLLRRDIDASPHEVIVCGDFNDTPVSYVTHRIRKNLYDSFRSGGQWAGATYPNVKIPLRIDYILHSRKMVSSGYQIDKVDFSDHRPVSCTISLDL